MQVLIFYVYSEKFPCLNAVEKDKFDFSKFSKNSKLYKKTNKKAIGMQSIPHELGLFKISIITLI